MRSVRSPIQAKRLRGPRVMLRSLAAGVVGSRHRRLGAFASMSKAKLMPHRPAPDARAGD